MRIRKRNRTRVAIIEAGVRLFREQGVDETTVEAIAAAADVSESTFYRYFPTKVDTLFPYLREAMINWSAALETTKGLPPIERLRCAARAMMSIEPNAMWATAAEVRQFVTSSRAATARQAELDREFELITIEALKSNAEVGELDRIVLATAVHAAMRSLTEYAVARGLEVLPEEAINALEKLFAENSLSAGNGSLEDALYPTQ